jgi:hypothetical protein
MRIEAKTELGWWLMPYRFANAADAEAFMATLVAKNEGRDFRVVAS